MRKQARFWVYTNGSPARVKINAGEILGHTEGGLTEEGYSYSTSVYQFDGRYVFVAASDEARDCDGRISREAMYECAVGELGAGSAFDGVVYPAWNTVRRSQRDYTAESMGY